MKNLDIQESNETTIREHLFISYASEDWTLADWLALKLASEGYKVWYDRIKLLGGESYPRDITAAIKNQTFRVLALLSRNSIEKPNPVKERTLALNIAKDRKVDFLIPINVDGLKPTELDFMTSDLTFISFNESWYEGFCGVLKKLQQIHAPMNQIMGRQLISDWLLNEEQPKKKPETIWSNLIPVLEIPNYIRKYNVIPEVDIESVYPNWPFVRHNENTVWAFGLPDTSPINYLEEAERINLRYRKLYPGNAVRNILTDLIHQSIKLRGLRKGLKHTEGFLYFPDKLLSKNKLPFTRYDRKKSYVKVVGERKFRITQHGITFYERSRYHLVPNFKFLIDRFDVPLIRLRIGIFWTNLGGEPLEAKKSNRRRKALCKNWWNYEWLSRVMAILQWLGDGNEDNNIIETDSGNLRIGFQPILFDSDVGIDESILPGVSQDDEKQILEEDEDQDEDGPDGL